MLLSPHPGRVGATPSDVHPDLRYHRPSGAPDGSATPPEPGRGAGPGERPTLYPRGPRPPLLPGRVPAHHSDHCYVEAGLPQTPVLLWVSGAQWRAVFENVLWAEYPCHYDGQHPHGQEIRTGAFYPTRFASLQGPLIPFTPQNSLVVYRARRPRRRASRLPSRQQVLLFEVVPTGEGRRHSALV